LRQCLCNMRPTGVNHRERSHSFPLSHTGDSWVSPINTLSALRFTYTMRHLAELIVRPRRRNPYPPATAAEIGEFERHFGLKLPETFTTFLQYANGGRVALCVYEDPVGGTGSISDFYGLGTKRVDDEAAAKGGWDIGNLYGETRIWRPFLGSLAMPFARDGGNNQLFLDLGGNSPHVNRFIAATRRSYQIASSFETIN
jgi:hypothetical protein